MSIVEDVAGFDHAQSTLIDPHTAYFVIMNCTVAQSGIAGFIDCYASPWVAEDIAGFEYALPIFVDEYAGSFAVMNHALPDDRPGVVDGDTGQRVRGDIAVFQQELSLRNIDGKMLTTLRSRATSQGEVTNDGFIGLHQDTISSAAFDDDLVAGAVAGDLDRFVEDNVFAIDAGTHEDTRSRCGCGDGSIDAGIVAAVPGDDEDCSGWRDTVLAHGFQSMGECLDGPIAILRVFLLAPSSPPARRQRGDRGCAQVETAA